MGNLALKQFKPVRRSKERVRQIFKADYRLYRSAGLTRSQALRVIRDRAESQEEFLS